MAERTPVVKKYRDSLETVIGATMEFLAKPTPPTPNQDPALSLTILHNNSIRNTPQQAHIDLPGNNSNFPGAAQESYIRGSATKDSKISMEGYTPGMPGQNGNLNGSEDYGYMPTTSQNSPGAEGRFEGRHGEMGQMDAEWLLSLCEGDGFSLQILNEMMRFEPSLGA